MGVVALSRSALRPVVIVASVTFAVLMVTVAVVPSATRAADYSKSVRGYVYDIDGRKVAGADVTIAMMNGGVQVSSHTETSNSLGYYNIVFEPTEWNPGYRILVTAIYNSLEASNATVVLCLNNPFPQWENVTFEYEIPELGSGYGGILVTGLLVGAMAVAFLVFVRKKP